MYEETKQMSSSLTVTFSFFLPSHDYIISQIDNMSFTYFTAHLHKVKLNSFMAQQICNSYWKWMTSGHFVAANRYDCERSLTMQRQLHFMYTKPE